MWKIKFLAHATTLGLEECFTSEFEDELPEKEKDAFDLDTSEGRAHAAGVVQAWVGHKVTFLTPP